MYSINIYINIYICIVKISYNSEFHCFVLSNSIIPAVIFWSNQASGLINFSVKLEHLQYISFAH